MALINATSFAGLLVLAYLSTFVLFAILRIATGISVQRIGLSSLRHISYTYKDGVRIDVRGLGFTIHRPTFAQPTWVSLRLQELVFTVDPAALHGSATGKAARKTNHPSARSGGSPESRRASSRAVTDKSKLWRQLTNAKEHLKGIHHKINWLRMLDFHASDTTLDVVGVGSLSVGSMTLAVHTRRKMLDRGRLFRHKKDPFGGQRPAEWIFTVRSIFLGVSGREPIEILDGMTANVHGLLYEEKSGLRDTSIAVKVGRLHIPVDDLLEFKSRAAAPPEVRVKRPSTHQRGISLDDVVEELERPGSREAAIVQTVADSKEFLSSVLRGVQEVQLGMSFIRVSKEVESLKKANLPVTMNTVIHEIGIDMHRLEQNSPAHRMYFSPQDIAHQALVAAVSISVSLDEDETNSSRIMYIPMATTTIRTTLPAKTMNFTEKRNAAERNSNVFFANLVITSPSIDLTPQHLMQVLAVAQAQTKSPSSPQQSQHRLISRLLPRAVMRLSIHEPVIRFVLPVASKTPHEPDDFDMIISSISDVSFDIESSYATHEDLLYSLSSNFRVDTHTLYYQSASGIKHNLLKTDSLEMKAQVTASSEILVVVSGTLNSFAVLMVREEVSQGVYNIMRHFHNNVHPEGLDTLLGYKESFLRKLPSWLLEFHFEGNNCSFETAGIDKSVSEQTRGVAFELESWMTTYVAHRTKQDHRMHAHSHSRRKVSASVRANEPPENVTHLSPPATPTKHQNIPQGPTDGRRLAVHVKGFQGFIIESVDEWEQKPFMSIPQTEIAFSTSRDNQGPTCHINSHIRAFYLDFSLYRAYSIGVAATVVQDAFQGSPPQRRPRPAIGRSTTLAGATTLKPSDSGRPIQRELLAVDVKASYLQIKAHMPHEPAMMLQVYDIAAGRHRWSPPSMRCHLLRLHATSPHVRSAWARIISVNAIRVDPRTDRKKTDHGSVEAKSVDISADFIRFAVPHGLRMFKVFDNFVNTSKSLLQLTQRFRTRSDVYVLKKGPEKPKHVPRISVRCRALMFELEDDAFEWRLSNIYHVGRAEQKQRLARADAFRLKLRKMQEERGRHHGSRRRAQSSRLASREPSPMTPRRSRSQNSESTPRRRSQSRGRKRRSSKLRYDREGICDLSSTAKVHSDEAWTKLQEYNARSWKARIDWLRQMQNSTVKNIRRMFSGADEPPPDRDDHETILAIPNRPGLLTIVVSDLHLIIDKPSFPLASLPEFMHNVGKGMPYDMQYALLIPMSLSLDMGEARFMLRDYPLNLLHVPAVRPGQPPRLPSWSLRTDFVIAEEFRSDQSIRHAQVEVVPKGQHDKDGKEIPGFAIDVRRTISPVKTYSMPVIDVNTSAPTSISWGTAYQPAIQDAMMIIESFTKPEVDPSGRVGFWDKIRLSFHSRPIINWKGDGDVQLRLKGSRDPYVVTGYGAGFVMCWRSNVRWAIREDDNPKRFMTVRSGEYVLAIPDYSHKAQAGNDDLSRHDVDSVISSSSVKNAAIFSKVIMKVSGNVQWTTGLVFERDLPSGGRSPDFLPHYDVVLRNPKFLSQDDLKNYDAFDGFRSQHIHLSIALAAPFDRDWTSPRVAASQSYNSFHLTPRFFSHFFAWWSLFSGVMSLPIRQGALWKGPEKTSKKFGRHLSTIKYGLFLSPLFIAHIYKHKDNEDYEKDVVSATGLKLRLDSFMLDVHQRREWFNTLSRTKGEQMRTSSMKINRAEVDFVNADLRAVAANITGTTADALKKATDEMLSSYQELVPNVDMSRFTIPDHDFAWIDMDDFVEMEWILPADSNPETRILPLAFAPRLTYFRQTDHGDAIHGDESRESPFGDEDTHDCVMPSRHNDPRTIQMHLIQDRLAYLEEQMEAHKRNMDEHELKVVRDGKPGTSVKEEMRSYQAQEKELAEKKIFLEHGLSRLAQREYPGEVSHMLGEQFMRSKTQGDSPDAQASSPLQNKNTLPNSHPPHMSNSEVDMDGLYSAPHDEYASDFNNRFIVHNAQVKWNNSLRNIILRYSHQVSQRRGFVYYMSRRAVKFILDIVNEQTKRKGEQRDGPSQNTADTPTATSPTEERDEDTVVEDRIQQLLSDANRFVNAEDPESTPQPPKRRMSTVTIDPEEVLAEDFIAMNSYNIRLIAPQIQLQSEKNTTSVVLLTAKGMQMKVVAIMDKARLSDNVSGLVQRRFALDMDGVQIFVSNLKSLSKFINLYSGNRYGNAPGSSWPPWASIETMFDFQVDPFGFQRVVQKTSASLRYEKYNPLRLKYNEEVAEGKEGHKGSSREKESRIDHLLVDFPRLRASCDSQQYYTMYIIVLDLLMYHEPLEKTRSERLEKIMLASDFSDLRGAPEMAERLQERIRQLSELKLQFMINARFLDKKGWQDRIDLERDLTSCEDELFFIMKAINTSQQRNDERSNQSSGFLRWYLSASQIVWHLMKDKNEPLLEFQLGSATYERIDNNDGSNHNAMEIEHIRGWNLLPNALYPEMIGSFKDPQHKQVNESPKMLQLHWFMLEAIAGIPVLEEFQVTMHPLKVQLERSLGKALFEYIFPGIGSSAFDSAGFSPLMVKNMKPIEDRDDEENEKALDVVSPKQDLSLPSQSEMQDASPGAIANRLQPTYSLVKRTRANAAHANGGKLQGLNIRNHRIGLFGHHNKDTDKNSDPTRNGLRRQVSSQSLNSYRSRTRDNSTISLNEDGRKLARTDSRDGRDGRSWGVRRRDNNAEKDKKKSDDVSQMVARASNYMTLAHVKLNSFVICLSYKGQRDRNLEDLHDFVFRMPPLEYRNKTWSNLDLALHLKKDVIRALISHTGAIIGNKLSHHRPGKKQAERLREIAAGNALLPNSDTLENTPSLSSGRSSTYTDSDISPPRMSFQSDSRSAKSADGSRRLEPSPLLTSGNWSNATDSRQRSKSSVGTAGKEGSSSNQTLSTSGRNGVRESPHSDSNFPYSPTSPSHLDPLGPILTIPPRPNTSGSSFAGIPGTSLLKDVVSRHFANGGSPQSGGAGGGGGGGGGLVRPTIHRARVRFKSSTNVKDDGAVERRSSQGSAPAPDPEITNGRSRSFSGPDWTGARPADLARTATGLGKISEGDTSGKEESEGGSPSTTKRKAVMSLGKRVFNGLKG
ncbi:Protein SABRE [Exophiala xenobiotica]|uniref:Protein SABRE n=1 Tax=Lithohypha guttulata TaxID=1690604 RepID=A0ABR0KMW9_9EURO|nr:Protein SABRE [Lithohypha guttulata]KAK5328895.1 Protein SABRE [Exophiala xenobiotica]